MDDRIAEIREALPIAERTVGPVNDAIVSVFDAARELLALLDSDALIIRRDETGEWPEVVTSRIHLYDAQGREFSGVMILDYVEQALASSQGVEPGANRIRFSS